jgi:hypothetical protein
VIGRLASLEEPVRGLPGAAKALPAGPLPAIEGKAVKMEESTDALSSDNKDQWPGLYDDEDMTRPAAGVEDPPP